MARKLDKGWPIQYECRMIEEKLKGTTWSNMQIMFENQGFNAAASTLKSRYLSYNKGSVFTSYEKSENKIIFTTVMVHTSFNTDHCVPLLSDFDKKANGGIGLLSDSNENKKSDPNGMVCEKKEESKPVLEEGDAVEFDERGGIILVIPMDLSPYKVLNVSNGEIISVYPSSLKLLDSKHFIKYRLVRVLSQNTVGIIVGGDENKIFIISMNGEYGEYDINDAVAEKGGELTYDSKYNIIRRGDIIEADGIESYGLCVQIYHGISFTLFGGSKIFALNWNNIKSVEKETVLKKFLSGKHDETAEIGPDDQELDDLSCFDIELEKEDIFMNEDEIQERIKQFEKGQLSTTLIHEQEANQMDIGDDIIKAMQEDQYNGTDNFIPPNDNEKKKSLAFDEFGLFHLHKDENNFNKQ